MYKVLFFIPNLSVGGAEKVLVNLVNNLDKAKFDVTVQVLFAGGVNEQFLNSGVKYRYCFKKSFRGNIHYFKLFSPKTLYKRFIKEHYDIIVSYLEGPAARIVSGCTDENTRLVSWIHIEQHTKEKAARSFRSFDEAKRCYEKFDRTICVSEFVKKDFTEILDFKGKTEVLYNTIEAEEILRLSEEAVTEIKDNGEIKICVVGKLLKIKGCDRIARIQKKLLDSGLNTHVYFLGEGPDRGLVADYAKENGISDKITFLGYQTNPYKFVKKCDLFVCASLAEGFSTAVTEALVVGTPVVTVLCSGMTELLGGNNEYGIVTENNENALYDGVKNILTTPGLLSLYARRAGERGRDFSTEKTVRAAQAMLEDVIKSNAAH